MDPKSDWLSLSLCCWPLCSVLMHSAHYGFLMMTALYKSAYLFTSRIHGKCPQLVELLGWQRYWNKKTRLVWWRQLSAEKLKNVPAASCDSITLHIIVYSTCRRVVALSVYIHIFTSGTLSCSCSVFRSFLSLLRVDSSVHAVAAYRLLDNTYCVCLVIYWQYYCEWQKFQATRVKSKLHVMHISVISVSGQFSMVIFCCA